MAKPHERVIALVLAFVFFATSVAAGVAVILQIRSDNKQKSALNQDANKNNPNKQQTADKTKPEEGKLEGTILANYTPAEKAEALQIIDTQEGTGEGVKLGDTITAHYTGAFVKDGVIFQSSLDSGQPFTAQLVQGGLIDGWIQGIPGMKAGGKRRLVIPASLAYGEQGNQGIPPNSDLVFDIELVSIGQ